MYNLQKRIVSFFLPFAAAGILGSGCSAYTPERTNITLSDNKIIDIFGGVTDRYNPKIAKIEFEKKKEDGLSRLTTPFLGIDGKEYEIGIDFGAKQREYFGLGTGLYLNYGAGFVYGSKHFDDQDTKFNFHINAGIGLESNINDGCNFVSGLDFNHASNAKFLRQKIQKTFNMEFNKSSKNSGINTLGFAIGFSCAY